MRPPFCKGDTVRVVSNKYTYDPAFRIGPHPFNIGEALTIIKEHTAAPGPGYYLVDRDPNGAGFATIHVDDLELVAKSDFKDDMMPRRAIVSIDVDFVREAYEAACSGWKRKIREKFPNLFEAYSIGAVFDLKASCRSMTGKFLLVQHTHSTCCLVSMREGNRIKEGVTVGAPKAVTRSEIQQMLPPDVTWTYVGQLSELYVHV
jgi:hypothetical protein